MAVKKSLEHLPDDTLDLRNWKWSSFLVEVLLHILVKELEYQVQLVFAMHDINEVNYIYMLKLS